MYGLGLWLLHSRSVLGSFSQYHLEYESLLGGNTGHNRHANGSGSWDEDIRMRRLYCDSFGGGGIISFARRNELSRVLKSVVY